MALILAIEPDRRQASQLTAIVRGRLHAEFVIGDSAEHALSALGERVPDLVLTTALLSPKDESALADRLRALDGVAAHVQTLTIPVLASPGRGRRAAKTGGVLSALLGDKSGDDGPVDGCDPAVFAEQCKEYLERAATERAVFAETAADALPKNTVVVKPAEEPPAVVTAPEPPPTKPSSVVNSALRAIRAAVKNTEAPASLMAAVAALAGESDLEEPVPSQAAAAEEIREEEADVKAHYDFVDVDLSEMLDEGRGARNRDNDEEPALEVYEIDGGLLDDEQVPLTAASEAEPYTPLTRPEARSWPILEGFVTGAQGFDEGLPVDAPAEQAASEAAEVPEVPAAAAAAAPAPAAPVDERRQWMDIIEALRRDVEPGPIAPLATELRKDATPLSPDPAEADPSADNGANGRKKRRRRGQSPVQDEWGFFDPDRAGFAALLEKLEEITESDDPANPAKKPRRA